jgi:hypothetical protein
VHVELNLRNEFAQHSACGGLLGAGETRIGISFPAPIADPRFTVSAAGKLNPSQDGPLMVPAGSL